MSFAQNFRDARSRSGMSQECLAQKLHISRQAISRYENGTAEPSIDMLNEISVILQVSLESLVGAKKEPTQYKDFDSLSKDDKKLLWYDFIACHKCNMYLLPIIYMLCMNFGLGTAAYSIISMLNASTSVISAIYVSLLIGALLIAAIAIYLLINNSMIASRLFNKQLREQGIIRRKKLMI